MTRLFARSFLSAFAATLVLTGCQEAGTSQPPAAPPAEAPEPALRWESVSGGEGEALVLLDGGDRPLLHLACLDGPARMTARALEFRRIGSEERLTLGVGGEAFLLVADPMREDPGVYAEGPIEPDLLDRFLTTTEISAVYGAQQLGPHAAPEPAQRERFVAGCREIAGGGRAA